MAAQANRTRPRVGLVEPIPTARVILGVRMKRSAWSLLLLASFVVLRLGPALGQEKEAAKVFKPAIDEIRGKTPIPILLPSRLPDAIYERAIKFAWGSVDADGYGISLYYEEIGSNSSFAARFAAFRQSLRDLPNVRPVTLANGIVGMFRPVNCGGSCAPANLWWEQNGVTYQIQIK